MPVWMDYMAQALKGVPEYQMPTPSDVASVGGELYFDTFLPGQGFVPTVGISAAALHPEEVKDVEDAAPVRTGEHAGAANPPAAVRQNEPIAAPSPLISP